MLEGKGLVIDYEYNNINAFEATKVWCASTRCLTTGTLKRFAPKTEGDHYHDEWRDEFIEYVQDFDFYVGHHFFGAEYIISERLLDWKIPVDKIVDTLVYSRVLRPVSPPTEKFPLFKKMGWDNRAGGHGLAAWGRRLGFPKFDFDDFTQYTFAQGDYCDQDTLVNVKLLEVLIEEKRIFDVPDQVFELESWTAYILNQQSAAGFTLHVDRAKKLLRDTDRLIEEYTAKLHEIFPEQKKLVEVYKPRFNKDGALSGGSKKKLINWLHEQNDDGTYNLYVMETFNPNSPQQVGERLISLGWKPRKLTPTGKPSTRKEVIGEAIELLAPAYPQVEVLRKFNIVTHRNQTAREWLNLAENDGKVHGSVAHVGPWTHRSSHFKPNMGNIAKVKLDDDHNPVEGLEGNFGWDSRHCWIPRKNWTLVGCDASGIQLRALAEYMADPDYIKEVCEGDVHVANQIAAGIVDRPTAKTFIYSWLLGAGDEKVGMIVGVDESEWADLFKKAGSIYKWNFFTRPRPKTRTQRDNLLTYVCDKLRKEKRPATKDVVAVILKGFFTKKAFLENLPALKAFRENVIPQAAKRGHMVGLDGRKIWVPSEHLAMGAYLQGFEAVVMKKAMVMYHKRLWEMGIEFQQVGYVHDEYQVECPPEHAEIVGETIRQSIIDAGTELGLTCPLDGEYKVGSSWAETH